MKSGLRKIKAKRIRVIYQYEPTPDREARLERLAELLLGASGRDKTGHSKTIENNRGNNRQV